MYIFLYTLLYGLYNYLLGECKKYNNFLNN